MDFLRSALAGMGNSFTGGSSSAAASGGGEDGGGAAAALPPQSNKCAKDYTMTKELGSGAYSVVLLGKHKKTGEEVAVKKIKKSHLQPHDHDQLKDEVELLRQVHCKSVISFKAFYDEEEYYYVVTEVVGGGELFDRICEKVTYTEGEARELVVTLLKTLAYLHKRNIAHRDLKPENLLLRSLANDTDVVLADFGFACVCDGATLTQVCGTPDYVAPEVISRKPYDFSCDIWSAGVLVFILLGGYAPFQAKDPDDRDALFKIIKTGKFKFHEKYWKGISKEAKDFIAKMLTLDLGKRATAEELLTHEWVGLDPSVLQHELDLTNLKEFNAKRKLRAVGKAVIGIQRMKSAVAGFSMGAHHSSGGGGGGAAEAEDGGSGGSGGSGGGGEPKKQAAPSIMGDSRGAPAEEAAPSKAAAAFKRAASSGAAAE